MRKKILFTILSLLLCVQLAGAQDAIVTSTITAVSQDTSLSIAARGQANIQVSGTWVGTLAVTRTVDGTNFVDVKLPNGTSMTITANGIYEVPVAALQRIKVASTAWTSGSASITLRASSASPGTVVVGDGGSSITVDGPLTNTELRASPVPVSGTVTTGGLTDAELRASPVPVDGSGAIQPVSGPTPFVASGTLGALNDTVEVTLDGMISVGAVTGTSNLVGTIIFETSIDHSVWRPQTTFWNGVWGSTWSNPTSNVGITGLTGAYERYWRIRVSAYTSGSLTPTVIANLIGSPLSGNPATTIPNVWSPFFGVNVSGVDSAGVARSLRNFNSAPGASDYGTVTRQVGLPAAAALADDTANPTLTSVAVYPFVFDGATWDRLAGNSTDGLLVNLGGNNDVTVTSSALPAGAATAVNQASEIASLASIDGKLPAQVDSRVPITTGIHYADPLSIGSDPVFPMAGITSTFQWLGLAISDTAPAGTEFALLTRGVGTQDVNVTSSALPTGAATSANQTNGTQQSKLTDGTDVADVVAASTAPLFSSPALNVTMRESVKNGDSSVTSAFERGQGMFANGQANSWRPIPIIDNLYSGTEYPRLNALPIHVKESAYGDTGATQTTLGALNATADTYNWTESAIGAMVYIKDTGGSFSGTITPVVLPYAVGASEIPSLAFDQLGNRVTTLAVGGIYYIPTVRNYIVRLRVTAYTSGSTAATIVPTVHPIATFTAASIMNTVTVTGPLTDTQLRATPVPVSGTVAVTQATATNLKAQAEVYQGGTAVGAAAPLQVTLANTGANATAVKTDGSAVTQPVSIAASVTVAQATATNLKAQAEVYQGGTAVGAAAPLQVSLANTAANGTAVKTDGSAVTQPVSQATASNLNAQAQGAAASGAAKAGNPVQIGGVFNTTQPTVTTGQVVEAQSTARGAQIVATGTDTFNVTVNAALPSGTNAIGKLAANSGVDIGDVDVTSLPALVAGSAIIGKVGIDQTTPGTTNGVQINAALPTGANAIGKLAANSGVDIGDVDVTSLTSTFANAKVDATGSTVKIDQTTTANDVDVVSEIPGTGATNLGKAEDATVNSADTGVSALYQRRDTASILTSAEAEYSTPTVDAYGSVRVTSDHVNRVKCYISSTATTSTIVTGCSAPGANLSIYVTSMQWYSSIISTTANFMRIQSGTGGTCGTATTILYDGYASVAFGGNNVVFNTPLKLTANHELCFVHASAGTRLVSIQGFIAP